MGLAVIKPPIAALDLEQVNRDLAGQTPAAIVRWALRLGLRPFLSTSFGPNAAVMLDLVSSVDSTVPVVWVDKRGSAMPRWRSPRKWGITL